MRGLGRVIKRSAVLRLFSCVYAPAGSHNQETNTLTIALNRDMMQKLLTGGINLIGCSQSTRILRL